MHFRQSDQRSMIKYSQADLQVMIDEWVTILTNEHVGVCCSFIIPADEIYHAMIFLFSRLDMRIRFLSALADTCENHNISNVCSLSFLKSLDQPFRLTTIIPHLLNLALQFRSRPFFSTDTTHGTKITILNSS